MNELPRQRLRLRYRKDEVLMWISHRDLLRFVMRLVRRAEVPFATSGRFSPKPKVTFGPALPLGVMADNELLDIELEAGLAWEVDDVKRCAKAISDATLPRDFLAGLTIVKQGSPTLGKSISAATYSIDYPEDSDTSAIEEILGRDSLEVVDKKDRAVDLRRVILSWKLEGRSLQIVGNLADGQNLNITLLAGLLTNEAGLKPDSITRLGFLDNMGRQL